MSGTIIQNNPVGYNENTQRNEILQVLPNGAVPTPMAVKTVSASAVTNVALSGASFVVIGSKDNNVFYRFQKADDVVDVTKTDGGNARGEVLAGTQRVEVPIAGATFISLIGGDGAARVTIEQRA